MNARFVAGVPPPVLSMVKISLLVPPTAIGSVWNALEKPGGAWLTVRESLGPWTITCVVPKKTLREPDVFVCVPTVGLVVSTETVQLEPAGTSPPV